MTSGELRKMREKAKMSRSMVARKLKCAENTIAQWERGINNINGIAEAALLSVIPS